MNDTLKVNYNKMSSALRKITFLSPKQGSIHPNNPKVVSNLDTS